MVAALVRIFASALILLLPGMTWGSPMLFTDTGANAAAIQGTVDSFRSALGDPNNGNTPGPLPTGRREINWDGGDPTLTATAPGGTPFTVFLNTRGALITTPGTGFVQAPPSVPPGGFTDGLASFFANPTYGTIFTTFSASRLFSASGSNITDVDFFAAGSNGGLPAFVRGFGVVFTDVDLANTTTIEYFDQFSVSLGKFAAPIFNQGLSFLGVIFSEGSVVDRVRITSGNAALGPNDGGGVDVVAMDDFIYSEPVLEPSSVPEPFSAALLGIGFAGLLAIHRRRKRI